MSAVIQDTTITIRLPATIKIKLTAQATEAGMSLSSYLRQLCARAATAPSLEKAHVAAVTPSPYDLNATARLRSAYEQRRR